MAFYIYIHQYISKVIKEFPAAITANWPQIICTRFGTKVGSLEMSKQMCWSISFYLLPTEHVLIFKPAVSFLTTRVKDPDQDDWNKLVCVLCYLNGTRHLKLILSADSMNFSIHWYIDASHQVHEDCQGQIGSLMTLGKGTVTSSSIIII